MAWGSPDSRPVQCLLAPRQGARFDSLLAPRQGARFDSLLAPRQGARFDRWWWLAALVLWTCLAAFSCGPTTPEAPPRPRADLRLFVLTDPRGYLEPCGCQQRPLGGLDKLAATLAAGRKDGTPSLLVAAGDLTYGTELHPRDAEMARQQELWRAETLVNVWSALKMSAAAPGPIDFANGAPAREALRSKFPWLVENLSDAEGKPLAGLSRSTVLQAGAVKVGLFGLLAPRAGLALPEGARLDADLKAVAEKTSAALRAQGAKLVVALMVGERREARALAGHGPDVIVMGGLGADDAALPAVHEGTLLLHAGMQGQRVVAVDLELDASGAWHDASRWTLEAAKASLKQESSELAARIAAWEKEPGVKADDLATQRARLAQLEAEAKREEAPRYEGRWFSAALTDLAPEVKGDPAIAAQLDAHDKRVNEANAKVYVAPAPAPEGAPHYTGSEACKGCHEAAYAWWRSTKHGHAYATLVDRNKQFDLSCVGCHVVGYNKPGGSTVTHVENLKDVGCESCHGPGSQHNAEPEEKGLIARYTPEKVCVTCHNHEHSARFTYAAFRSLLIVPGHGQPVASAGTR
jgi:hypothetical protein